MKKNEYIPYVLLRKCLLSENEHFLKYTHTHTCNLYLGFSFVGEIVPFQALFGGFAE